MKDWEGEEEEKATLHAETCCDVTTAIDHYCIGGATLTRCCPLVDPERAKHFAFCVQVAPDSSNQRRPSDAFSLSLLLSLSPSVCLSLSFSLSIVSLLLSLSLPLP